MGLSWKDLWGWLVYVGDYTTLCYRNIYGNCPWNYCSHYLTNQPVQWDDFAIPVNSWIFFRGDLNALSAARNSNGHSNYRLVTPSSTSYANTGGSYGGSSMYGGSMCPVGVIDVGKMFKSWYMNIYDIVMPPRTSQKGLQYDCRALLLDASSAKKETSKSSPGKCGRYGGYGSSYGGGYGGYGGYGGMSSMYGGYGGSMYGGSMYGSGSWFWGPHGPLDSRRCFFWKIIPFHVQHT